MLSPMVGAQRLAKTRTVARPTLRVVLDFDFRVGKLQHGAVQTADGAKYRRQTFHVHFAGETVMELYRYGRDEGWEYRWIGAPTWLRGVVELPVFIDGGKADAGRKVVEAFRDGLRAYFRQFDPGSGRMS